MNPLQVQVTACGRTDVGRVRKNNEDAWVVVDLADGAIMSGEPAGVRMPLGARGVLLAVADGVGGSAAGEIASATALDSLGRTLSSTIAGSEPAATLLWSIDRANRDVWMAAHEPGRDRMATTLTAVLIVAEHAFIGQVGDSRAYLFRDGVLAQLTRDQSYLQVLSEAGFIADGDSSPFKGVILQAVGRAPDVAPALGQLALRRGDRLLVCSDGLSGPVGDPEIARILASDAAPETTCTQLVEAAKAGGGPDNITVVLAVVAGDGLPLPAAGEDAATTLTQLVTPDLE